MAPSKKDPGSRPFPSARVVQAAGALLVVGALGYFLFGKSEPRRASPSAPQVVKISVPPPPPPPPPPKPKTTPDAPPPPDAPQMVAETAAEPDPAPAAPASADAPLGTGIKGDGPDSFGLGTGGGGGGGGSRLASSGGGTRWAGYGSSVKTRVLDAIRADDRTRFADGQVELGLWLDAEGRVTRVAVRRSTAADTATQALRGDLLVGLRILPPPSDMPQPIWLRTTLRAAN